MHKIKLLPLGLGLALAGSAHAAVYSCVNDKGEKFISDKACPPNQSTQKVYKQPAAPAAGSRRSAGQSAGDAGVEGMPEGATPAEMEALMRVRLMQRVEQEMNRQDKERAEQDKQDKADADYRRRHEATRQMESYLQQTQE